MGFIHLLTLNTVCIDICYRGRKRQVVSVELPFWSMVLRQTSQRSTNQGGRAGTGHFAA